MILDKYRRRRAIAAIVAAIINPIAWPGWTIEAVVRRYVPDWEFDAYSATPYFAVIMGLATAGLLSGNIIWMTIAVYVISATELLVLWMCLTIALGRSGFARRWLSEFGRRRKPVSDGKILLDSTALYVGISAYVFTIYFFACAGLILHRLSPGSYSGIKCVTASRCLWDFFYFSVVTIATVGYGDIFPVSATAKLLVILETGLGLFFIVFLFGTFTSHRVSQLTSDKNTRSS